MALAPGCHPQAPACGEALRARPTIEVGHHWFRIQQWHVETWRLHQMSEDSPWKMGLSENSVTQVLMVCHHISYWSGHTWGVLYFQTHPNDEKWWKWLELEITWTIHGTNFDFGWLPRLFHSTSARPAEEMRPVAASLPQAALPVYWGFPTSRRLGNRTAMAWQCSLVTGACYVYVDVGRWLLYVVVCCCCFLKDEGLESLRFAHDMLSSLRHIGIFQ